MGPRGQAGPPVSERVFTEEERAHYAEHGEAMPDGSYPIPDCDALGRAIEAYPRAPQSHREDLAALIERRNEELECGHDLSAVREEVTHVGAEAEHEAPGNGHG